MNMNTKFLFIVLLLCVLLVLLGSIIENRDLLITIRNTVCYYRVNDLGDYNASSLPLMDIFYDVATEYNNFFKRIDNIKAQHHIDFLCFESLNNIDYMIRNIGIPYSQRPKWVYGLNGSDNMASKRILANMMQNNGASHLIPETYITNSYDHMQYFIRDNDPSTVYILKKDIQRQEGIFISSNMEEIMKVHSEYVVIQKMLQDPFIVGKRKINIRIYMLAIVRESGICEMYMYNDGFMYYTPKYWVPGTIDKDINVTTGYIDRQVYIDNPLTLRDLGQHIGDDKYDRLMGNLKRTFKELKRIYAPVLAASNMGVNGKTKFLIYGVDIAPSETLDCKIMEINKGPDLSYKDERDKLVKYNMMRACLELVGMIPSSKHQTSFIKL